MSLVELTITQFMKTLGSDAPAPGGGSASALSGVTGVSLLKMVCELTVGRKKYAEYEEEIQAVKEKAAVLQDKLLLAIDEDTESFNEVSAVFSMPKETDEDKKARAQAMQAALKSATKTPYKVMELLLDVLTLTNSAVGKSNTNASSDLGVAALQAKAALQGAWLNVLTNLSGIKDETFVNEYKTKGLDLYNKGCLLADDIFETIQKTF
ncbi:cyclodeaminase/cyclohydrolase family protein [Carnobacteriaceae bacterium zg-ZUI252]|nr:cyclodeaminase/cyclohydrolase family protein [Carnobacteriaceae bacterium zg-ZUI252]MBS4770727.1 cyclodeaminase/cyclohydrolase family protein [Carnobacteriaceae bacterium zg-ZUI240]QTU82460.1 cyclodeaminase/cyclohydrolase family protein [Carnobacteriaceae bacterium zg-C25]